MKGSCALPVNLNNLCSLFLFLPVFTAADTGGEFVAAASLDLKSWFPEEHWFMPTEDLVNIYANLNASGEGPLVEPQWINECAVLFYAGSFGVSHFGDLIYPFLAPKLGGVLLEQFFDFPVGGIDDDAAWTSFMWNRLAEWLVYGPPPDDPPPNFQHYDTTSKMKGGQRHQELIAKKSYIASIRKILHKEPNLFDFQTLPSGAVKVGFAPGISADRLSEDVLKSMGEALIHDYLLVLFPELNTLSHDPEAQLRMKHLMDNLYTRVETIKDTEKANELMTTDLTDDHRANLRVVTSGKAEHEYHSSSLTVLSNGQDVLIGSPGAGVLGAPQEGSATLMFSVNDETSGEPPKFILFEGGHGVNAAASSTPSYERFGWASAACDLNQDSVDDLVICAPSYQGGRNTTAARGNYTGRCDIFYGPFIAMDDMKARQPNVSVYGDKEWGNFGYAVSCGDINTDGIHDLVVSAPFAGSYMDISPDSHGDLSSQGSVYIFTSTSSWRDGMRLEASASADIVLQPEGAYQWFGKSLDIATIENEIVLLVGAPVYHPKTAGAENSAVGRIYGYDTKVLNNENKSPKFTLTGCHHAASTGHAIASSKSHLAFSETGWNSTDESVLRGGRIISVEWESLLDEVQGPSTTDIRVCDLITSLNEDTLTIVEGLSFDGRYGSSLTFFGDNNLVIGAPLADEGRGRVFLVDVSTGSEEEMYTSTLKEKSWGKARVGQSIAVTGVEGATGFNILAGAPYSTCDTGEQTGRLLQFQVRD